nr:MAG TPA: hypothetical protein [Caudoviricetes sp.]
MLLFVWFRAIIAQVAVSNLPSFGAYWRQIVSKFA